jgi:uncharacterized membrane protein
MEQFIKIAIYIHAFFGGLGLISGCVSVFVKKGRDLHKKSGTLFSLSMCVSCLLSLMVASFPNHENPFLFLIGVFTIYLVFSGNRALNYKGRVLETANLLDVVVSYIMLVISITVFVSLIYSVVVYSKINLLYLVFGSLGVFISIVDFRFFKHFKKHKKAWLKSHIGRMLGAFIASITAFIVAGLSVKSLFAWLLPTVFGTLYIMYWNRKIKSPSLKRKEHLA